ncbi:MbtH family protein [Streptomyces sp. NPDC048291]|uniref:MbtH family protein n=1 Tax=Streptomyces sp. NPDC048291 TaxID=3365530 RepID=UPI0037148661
MSVNPFDDETGRFHVVVNDEGQHAIWPDFAAVPAGWRSVAGPDSRTACLAHVEEHWTDLAPAGLRHSG